MADPELREKFGKAGRKRAEEKFSWSSIAKETKKLYDSLVAKPAQKSKFGTCEEHDPSSSRLVRKRANLSARLGATSYDAIHGGTIFRSSQISSDDSGRTSTR